MALPGQTPKDPALTQREFDTWREEFRTFSDTILRHVDDQGALNLKSEGRISALETNLGRIGTIAGWVSALVAALVGGLAGAFWSK